MALLAGVLSGRRGLVACWSCVWIRSGWYRGAALAASHYLETFFPHFAWASPLHVPSCASFTL